MLLTQRMSRSHVILDMALRSEDGIPDVLVVDYDSKFTSTLFKVFTKRIGSTDAVFTMNNAASALVGNLTQFLLTGGSILACHYPTPTYALQMNRLRLTRPG